jgi:8-oxo-dGTP pyrophosphatase MutT (NUDIX family)
MSSIEVYLLKISRTLKPVTEKTDADAAVALLLRAHGEGFEILFVKRVENPADFWSGQVALPGGRREISDESLRQTAIRETFEETGIDLTKECRSLGVLKVFTSIMRNVRVQPFVFFLEHEVSIKLNQSELEEYAWIEPESLTKNRGKTKFSFGEAPSFNVGKYVIWGLTYRILDEFLALLNAP